MVSPEMTIFFGLFSHTFKIKPTLDNTLVDITLNYNNAFWIMSLGFRSPTDCTLLEHNGNDGLWLQRGNNIRTQPFSINGWSLKWTSVNNLMALI
jgi:hypothetical protein